MPADGWAAYGRGIAKIKRGDFAGGSEDIVMAKTANANLAAQFASYGLNRRKQARQAASVNTSARLGTGRAAFRFGTNLTETG